MPGICSTYWRDEEYIKDLDGKIKRITWTQIKLILKWILKI
jgi:hypothetical protein